MLITTDYRLTPGKICQFQFVQYIQNVSGRAAKCCAVADLKPVCRQAKHGQENKSPKTASAMSDGLDQPGSTRSEVHADVGVHESSTRRRRGSLKDLLQVRLIQKFHE